MITIRFGVNNLNRDVNGFVTVGDVRRAAEEALSIPEGAGVRVNNQPVGDDAAITDGSVIEFVKFAGEKGAVVVKHGINNVQVGDVAGLTVRQVYDRFKSALNLTDGLQVRVNGVAADGAALVRDGQNIEFVKVAGEKGR